MSSTKIPNIGAAIEHLYSGNQVLFWPDEGEVCMFSIDGQDKVCEWSLLSSDTLTHTSNGYGWTPIENLPINGTYYAIVKI